jgi:hypothetical protein
MADEIINLRFARARSGSNWEGYFIDPIDPVIATWDGVTVIPTPSTGIPLAHLDAQLFTPEELIEFDEGTKAWTRASTRLTDEEDENAAAAAVKIRELYAAVDRVAEMRDQFRQLGRRLDAVQGE